MILSLIRLTRPYYCLPLSGGLPVITAYLVGGQWNVIDGTLLLAVLALYSVMSAAYLLNDFCDLPIDAVNHPQRVLPAGQIAPHVALTAAGVLFTMGLGLALLCGWRFFVLLTSVAISLAAYDVYSKRMGPFKPVAVAILTTSLYPLAFALNEAVDTPRLGALWIHPIWLFATTLGYEMLKDIRDIPGDSLSGDRSWLVRSGKPGFLLAARTILLSASLLTLIPFVLGYCRTVYLFSSLVAIGLVIVSLRKSPVGALPYIYGSVFIIAAGSLADLWVFGP